MGGIKWLESRGIKNPVLIPNSIETETIIARQNQILSDAKIHFLFVGRLLKGKGGLEAIKILQIFQQLTPGILT